MDERDLYELLTQDPRREAQAPLLLHKLKTAGWKDDAKTVYETVLKPAVQARKPEILGALVGAAAGGAGGYGISKRWKGQPSLQEQDADELLAAHAKAREAAAAKGKDIGFAEKYTGAVGRGYHEATKAMAEHPRSAALLFAASMAGLGSKTGRLVASLKGSR